MLRLNLLQKYKRPIPWRAMGFAFLLGVLVAAAGMMLFFRLGGLGGQGPDRVVVTPNPTRQERRTADAVIKEERVTRVTGEKPLPPQPPSPPDPEDHPRPDEIESPGGDIVPDPPRPPGLYPGDVVIVPVEGEINSTWYDSKTGREAGSGVHQMAGETTVEITEDLSLRVSTEFRDSIEIAIDLPDPPQWWAGLILQGSIQDGFRAGGFLDYRREIWRFRRCAVTVGGGLEIYPNWRDLSETDLEVEIRAGLAW